MKIKNLLFLTLLFSVAACAAAQTQSTVVVEAEAFQFPGSWTKTSFAQASGNAVLFGNGADNDAVTAVSLPQSGEYSVWVRTRDFDTDTGKRRFKLALDGEFFSTELGAHGFNGWKWEKAGTRALQAGDHALALHDTARFYARADAILLTSDAALDPNKLSNTALAALRVAPKKVAATTNAQPFAPVAALKDETRREVAVLENEFVRVRFLAATDAEGKTQIVRETVLKKAAKTRVVPAGEEKLFVLSAPQTEFRAPTMLPSWSTPNAPKQISEFEIGGKKYQGFGGDNDPFWAAPAQALVPRAARALSKQKVQVDYETASGLKARGVWELLSGTKDARFSVQFAAPAAGFYSIGFSPFGSFTRAQMQYDLLSPLFQLQRLPSTPVLLTNGSTPHPLALAQVGAQSAPLSLAITADPDRLPFEWAKPDNARYGFSLLNAQSLVQPTSFAPVLGLPSSQFKVGQTVSAAWRVLAFDGDWKGALEYSSQHIFGVTDYRKPYGASLSDAALNMIALMKNADASGWDARLKGFYNIEAKGVASQAAPLAVVEAAILTRDEELWKTRALPTIEYTLSRPGAHFATEAPDPSPNYVSEAGTKIKVPSDFYGTAYWQGLHQLLGKANPWIAGLALPDGEIRYRTSYSSMPRWSELLAAYRLHPSTPALDAVKAEADQWLQSVLYKRTTTDLGVTPFYNVSFYPYWWDLLDLYEVTHDKKYLDAAQDGAFFTIAGLWSHPRVPAGDVTIHPGGEYGGESHIWWKGDKLYRLGWPRTPGDTPEHKVPAWLVSQMGLGLEQPSTYYASGGSMRNIMMSAWAPNLLRLYRYTGREIFRTYARNSIISRFGNYPGYYLSGYTDLELSPDYPYKGPDVTSIYYHHIPPQLAFTIDYLVTEAGARSQGKISFPWAKQQGYVWFTNRVYGEDAGEVFGDNTARLWLNRDAASVKSPAINTLLARGDERVWIILMNEAGAATTAKLSLDKAALQLTGAAGTQFSAQGGSTPATPRDGLSVTVPAKGLIALSFPARRQSTPALKPVANGRASQKLAGDWGALEAFRIRSPFAKDSLYVVLTGRPKDGATATLKLEGQAPLECKSYPYEFSVYPIAMNRDMKFTIETKTADGKTSASTPIVLAGTP